MFDQKTIPFPVTYCTVRLVPDLRTVAMMWKILVTDTELEGLVVLDTVLQELQTTLSRLLMSDSCSHA